MTTAEHENQPENGPDREVDPAADPDPRGNPEPDEGAVERGEEQIEKISGN